MTENKNKKRSKTKPSVTRNKRVRYVLKKKENPNKVEPVKNETFSISIKQLVKENIHNSTRSTEFKGGYVSSEECFESEYNKFLKRTYRSSKSGRMSGLSSSRASPKAADLKSSVISHVQRRAKNSVFGTMKSMSPDSDVKIYRSNLKYSSIWDLIQIFEKRKKIFSQPKKQTTLRFSISKKGRGSVEKVIKKNSLRESLRVVKNPTAEYYQSKKNVL
jgi:hypothetical protein